MIWDLLCFLGLHSWKRTRRGNRFYCSNYPCKAERAWRKGDK